MPRTTPPTPPAPPIAPLPSSPIDSKLPMGHCRHSAPNAPPRTTLDRQRPLALRYPATRPLSIRLSSHGAADPSHHMPTQSLRYDACGASHRVSTLTYTFQLSRLYFRHLWPPTLRRDGIPRLRIPRRDHDLGSIPPASSLTPTAVTHVRVLAAFGRKHAHHQFAPGLPVLALRRFPFDARPGRIGPLLLRIPVDWRRAVGVRVSCLSFAPYA